MTRATGLKSGWAAVSLAAALAACENAEPKAVHGRRDRVVYGGSAVAHTEPVGEQRITAPWNERWKVSSPTDRYYNIMSKGWERPPPFGPANAMSPMD